MERGVDMRRIDGYWGPILKVLPAEPNLSGVCAPWAKPHVVFVGDEHTKCARTDDGRPWTSRVASRMDVNEINFGRDKASNEWIMAQASRIIEIYRPTIVVQWTDPSRYLFVDGKGRYRDFLENEKIERETLLGPNRSEAARRAFYEINTPGMGLHRLMLNSILLTAFAKAMDCTLVQVWSFLDDESLTFLRPRVEGVVGATSHDLAESVMEKLG